MHVKSTNSFFLVPPQWKDTPTSFLQVEEGSDVTLKCSAIGTPTPIVQWMRPFIGLPTNRTTVNISGLFIKRVTKTDNGIFVCKAKNILGELTAAINVNVQGN